MSNRRANQIRSSYEQAQEKISVATAGGYAIEVLQESFNGIVRDLLAFEDEGFSKLSDFNNEDAKGLSLKDAQDVTLYLERQTKILGDLLGRGLRLKNNHVFGRGFRYERSTGKIPPRFQAIIDDPHNQEELFSPTALKAINRIFFTSGNLFLMYDRTERQFHRLAVDLNIENAISDPRYPGKIKYYMRTWKETDSLSGVGNNKSELVPTASYDATNPIYPATIKIGDKSISVNKNAVIIDRRINRDNGEIWGVPDAFAAAAPAVVYASFLRDEAMVKHAIAAISFVVKAKTQAAAKTAGAKVQNGRVGQVAITGPETEIQTIPRAGVVNMYEGRPLVARVASALDVSVTGITSDTGTGGSYASENALSAPEQMSALSRQEDFANLFVDIFRVIGAEGVTINFNRLDVDPVHRQFQSAGIARTLGGINQEEFRIRSLELLDIEPTTSELPQPDEFTGSKYATLSGQIDAGLVNAQSQQGQQGGGSGVASQGNSGTVGSLDPTGNDARNSDNNAGKA